LRIAFTIDRVDPAKGGAESYLCRFGEWLCARGHQVTIVARRATLDPASPLRFEEVSAARWPRPHAERAFAARAAERAYEIADRVLAVRHARACDVYQPHGGLHEDVLAASNLRLSAKHRAFLDLERGLLGAPSPPRFVPLSQRVERSALARYPGLAGRVTVIPNGVDLDAFNPARRAESAAWLRETLELGDAPRFLFLAHNPRLKGIDTALAALARTPDAILIAVGRGVPEYAALARRLGVADRARLAGPIADAGRHLAGADLLVHPTRHDPCSLVALEALASGTPVVTTTRNGVSELMKDEPESGFVLDDPDDVDALVEAMKTWRDRTSPEAARALAERHPWERNFEAMEKELGDGV